MITLYHGSNIVIESVDLELNEQYLNYRNYE